jgi:hypothetical protein
VNDTQLLGLTLSKQIEQAAQRELELLRENAALRADKERMDWLAENTEITIKKVVSGFLIFEHNEIIWSEDKGKLREKIDAARKEAKP